MGGCVSVWQCTCVQCAVEPPMKSVVPCSNEQVGKYRLPAVSAIALANKRQHFMGCNPFQMASYRIL